MATLTTKFNAGDTVFQAEAFADRNLIQCPDCLGEARWKVILPNGVEDVIECPSCKNGYWSCGKISEYGVRGEVRTLTIGRVTYDDEGPQYMCEETGIGSGRLYREKDLFATEREAHDALPAMIAEKTKEYAERGLNEYIRKKGDGVGNMTAYYRKEIRDAKKKLEAAQKQLDRIRGGA